MARPSDIWLRSRDPFWMTTLGGKQVKLSRDKAEARKLLHKLLAAEPAPAAGLTVRKTADLYLAHSHRTAGRRRERWTTT